MMRPRLHRAAMPVGLLDGLVAELRAIALAKQPGNRAYRALLGDAGVQWKYDHRPEPVPAIAWTPIAARMRDLAAQMLEQPFDSATAFIYDGDGVTLAHSDYRFMTNVTGPLYAITSYGDTRAVVFTRDDGSSTLSYDMQDGDMLVVPREFDLQYLHHVPARPGAGLRVSLTFRSMAHVD